MEGVAAGKICKTTAVDKLTQVKLLHRFPGWSVDALRGVAGAAPRMATGALEACFMRYLFIFEDDSVFEFANYRTTHKFQHEFSRVLE
jgi:hypothetical protein